MQRLHTVLLRSVKCWTVGVLPSSAPHSPNGCEKVGGANEPRLSADIEGRHADKAGHTHQVANDASYSWTT